MTCMECGEEIVTTKGAGYVVKGIEVERDAGGTNHIYRRERTGEVMCSKCVVEMKYGIDKNQLTLA
jgi:hypothetical protein